MRLGCTCGEGTGKRKVCAYVHCGSSSLLSPHQNLSGLNAIDLEGYLEARKSYKTPAPAAAEI